MTKLKIGLFGIGHLGKIHLRCLLQSEYYELVGFYDPNDALAAQVVADFGLTRYASVETLLHQVAVVDIVTPTFAHFEIAAAALRLGKHVFIEKPVTQTVAEAEELLALANQNNLKVAVGHVERFNPAFLALHGQTALAPRFIEAHRLAMFNPRGTEVSVVLDLMIHDIDIILHLVKSKVKSIQANGVTIVSRTPDIANARIEFENGCVANVTASRLSLKQMRKVRLFQSDAYVSMDFLEKKAEIIRLFSEGEAADMDKDSLMKLDTAADPKYLQLSAPEPPAVNAILTELNELAIAIHGNKTPPVSLADGLEALRVALQIEKIILSD